MLPLTNNLPSHQQGFRIITVDYNQKSCKINLFKRELTVKTKIRVEEKKKPKKLEKIKTFGTHSYSKH